MRGFLDKKDGYVTVTLTMHGKMYSRRVHRLVYAAFYGTIPNGMLINHKDGVPSNNHVDNLELMTNGENVRHAFDVLGRRRSGEKLVAAQVVEIRMSRAGGAGLKEIAERFGVTEETISKIVLGKNWKHVGGPITVARPMKQGPSDVGKRISDDDVRAVIARYHSGESASVLADELQVNRRTIYNWIEGRVLRAR